MFGKLTEQVKKSSKPVNTLMTLNAKMLEQLTNQQTQLFKGVIDDSIELVNKVAQQHDLKELLSAQTQYAEALKERVSHASKESYNSMTGTREQVLEVVKAAFTESMEQAQEATESAKAAMTPATKAAAPAAKKAPAKRAPAKKPAAAKATTTKTAATNVEATKAEPVAAKAETAVPAPATSQVNADAAKAVEKKEMVSSVKADALTELSKPKAAAKTVAAAAKSEK